MKAPATPSRRAVIRTAAWTVPVISVAATAPAFAASPAGSTTMTWNTPVKWSEQSTKHVSWDLTFVNGAVAIDKITITFTYTPTGGGTFDAGSFVVRSFNQPTDTSWVRSQNTGATSTISATREIDIAANSTTNLHVDFAGNDNSSGTVSATAVITYVDGTTATLSSGNYSWASGSVHSH